MYDLLRHLVAVALVSRLQVSALVAPHLPFPGQETQQDADEPHGVIILNMLIPTALLTMPRNRCILIVDTQEAYDHNRSEVGKQPCATHP